ncbi:hypothetical protein FACS189430_04080 [Bacteroidia bacterium]|nr:hypothetical protein FACS189430_04080 [Bacteroidia bacterium]
MAIRKKGKYYYGDTIEDLKIELERYSKTNAYPIDETTILVCPKCGNAKFLIFSDDEESSALCQCSNCAEEVFIRDSKKYFNETTKDDYLCLCDNADFEIMIGTSFYKGTNDVRWVYTGGFCSKCGLLGNYIDWNER